MARTSLIQKIKKHLLIAQRQRRSGFTLTELLVSMIIGAFLVALLLGFVVEVTQNNQQDAARSQVQQDMQAAMDYITQDLREAVFVYNGDCLQGNGTPTSTQDLKIICPGVINHIPASMTQDGRVPVLAFWRAERLPKGIRDLCSAQAPNLDDTDQNNNPSNPLVLAGVPCISGNSYSLVVYALDPSNDGNIWQGKTRIIRYKLSQFTDSATTANDQTPGYVNPLNSPDSTFQQWPYGTRADKSFGSLQTTRPTNSPMALVDFVDDVGAPGVTPNCEEFAPTVVGNPNKDPNDIANALSPTNTNNRNRAFYACVRNGGIGNAAPKAGENQDVLISLVGNVTGQAGFAPQNDNQERLTPLQTRVLVRGVVNKVNPTS
ncbi:PilW family protein [Leptodesmis sichuanensis]|uniref:PilW family protein n=1 Tax=Leptodesmis sichuanensis TaxID=2906798 RepID=UPI001F422E87|nr:prepilin-type N-terminal cleavage/methylation domain-containing protein [Leptodesmis sichuanensis]UIE38793.1 prepilin-type N-terminal cleavage/methylation domain-containing protein [Leptodesmis sichuanensis A121]